MQLENYIVGQSNNFFLGGGGVWGKEKAKKELIQDRKVSLFAS